MDKRHSNRGTAMTPEQLYEACKWVIEQRGRDHGIEVFRALLPHIDDDGQAFADAIKGLVRIGWEAVKKDAEDKIAALDAKAAPEPRESD